MMKRIPSIILTAFLFLIACTQQQSKPIVETLNTKGLEAVGPYLTKDNKGNPVLCWTEQDPKDSLYRLKYAIYDQQANAFHTPVIVPASAGTSNVAESMGKVAFKSDGTVMALFSKRFLKEKNPYAGAIYYSFSADEGKSWSAARFLHSDTAHTYGRSFFDVTTLKDGELAATWLDGRYGKSIKGSALLFNRTSKGKGFGIDTCLDKGTCECCRTDILTDQAGNIHIAYRSITFPSALSNKQVRDMAYKLSTDNGKTFSTAKTISKDNWQIDGCPHSGPSLAITKSGITAVWFTGGGETGLYKTSSPGLGSDFDGRNLITPQGRHPQLISLPDGKLVMVCEENEDAVPEKPMEMSHSHGEMAMSHAPAAASKIVLRILNNGNEVAITDGHQADHHAVLVPINKGVLVAWIKEEKGHSYIDYSRINLD